MTPFTDAIGSLLAPVLTPNSIRLCGVALAAILALVSPSVGMMARCPTPDELFAKSTDVISGEIVDIGRTGVINPSRPSKLDESYLTSGQIFVVVKMRVEHVYKTSSTVTVGSVVSILERLDCSNCRSADAADGYFHPVGSRYTAVVTTLDSYLSALPTRNISRKYRRAEINVLNSLSSAHVEYDLLSSSICDYLPINNDGGNDAADLYFR